MIRSIAFGLVAWLGFVGAASAQPAFEDCSSPAIDISTAGTDTIAVTTDIVLVDFQCRIAATHAFIGDLTIDLASPSFTTVTLHSAGGGGSANINAVYWDFGVPSGTCTGTSAYDCAGGPMQPSGPGAMLDFAGETSLGDWTVNIVDAFPGSGGGTLDEWCVLGYLTSPPLPVSDLVCSPLLDTVELAWINNDVYDSVEVRVNGILDASLPGDATSYTTASLSPLPATAAVEVEGIIGGSGTLPVTCSVDLFIEAPTGLACSGSTGGGVADISWTLPASSPYDEILVTVNGALEATLPGTATSYQTAPAAVGTTIEVCLLGTTAVGDSALVCCLATLAADMTGEVVIYQGELATGLMDSVAAIESAMIANGLSPLIVSDLAAVGGQPSLLYLAIGTYPDNRELTVGEGAGVAGMIQNGVPVVCESSDTWGFDPATAFLDYDGVGSATDGNDTFVAMVGADFGPFVGVGLDAAYTQDQAGSDFTDQLQVSATDLAGPDAGVIWIDSTLAYNTGIFYDTTAGFGKVIGQSWEFGGYGGDQNLLMGVYLEALQVGSGGGPLFQRGDSNSDGGLDISDAVFSLGALFVPGSPSPTCADASDANDDGGFDISDAVYTLGALFVPGSPPPPEPNVCGIDPTDDALDCGAYAPCP